MSLRGSLTLGTEELRRSVSLSTITVNAARLAVCRVNGDTLAGMGRSPGGYFRARYASKCSRICVHPDVCGFLGGSPCSVTDSSSDARVAPQNEYLILRLLSGGAA